MEKLKSKNLDILIIGHININSLRNKFEFLSNRIKEKLDVLMISETKLDNTFPISEFLIEGFSTPYRLDRNKNGGGIMLYVREDIPSKLLVKQYSDKETENFFVELNLRSKKWLVSCSYNPHTNLIEDHLNHVRRNIDYFLSEYGNFIVLGDFNAEMNNHFMEEFCHSYNLKHLIKEPTCFKNPEKPTCIDLILTNHPKSFHQSLATETGLSDFHKLTVTVLKSYFRKQEPKIVMYRDYKNFSNDRFRDELVKELSNKNILAEQFEMFKGIILKVLDKHAPLKKKYIRSNQAAFMNKDLNKAIMNRTRLLNRFRKVKSELNRRAYTKQRNYCVKLLRKRKKDLYNNLNIKNITDNKLFWKTMKPCFSDKLLKDEKITLVEEEKIF